VFLPGGKAALYNGVPVAEGLDFGSLLLRTCSGGRRSRRAFQPGKFDLFLSFETMIHLDPHFLSALARIDPGTAHSQPVMQLVLWLYTRVEQSVRDAGRDAHVLTQMLPLLAGSEPLPLPKEWERLDLERVRQQLEELEAQFSAIPHEGVPPHEGEMVPSGETAPHNGAVEPPRGDERPEACDAIVLHPWRCYACGEMTYRAASGVLLDGDLISHPLRCTMRHLLHRPPSMAEGEQTRRRRRKRSNGS